MYKRLALLSVVVAFLAGCQSDPSPSMMDSIDQIEALEPTGSTIPEEALTEEETTAPAEDTTAVDSQPMEAAEESVQQPQNQNERNTTMILMKTSMGDIKIELDSEKAPKTVENFLSYVQSGHYEGTIFHRVMNGFMIQGGGFDENMKEKPAPRKVENEASNGLKNTVGSIAMARTPDPHSAGAQFFININDNAFLDYPGQDGWGYCVFGQVVEGMEVVDSIKTAPTGNRGPHQNVPTEPILITEISVIE